MTHEPYGITIFCDNIRHEIDGKITIIGCYTGEMNFKGPAPGLLPTFAALVNVRIPKQVSFNSIRIHVTKEEGSEISTILDAESESEVTQLKQTSDAGSPDQTEEKIISITFPCEWVALQIKAAGFIKVRAYLDGNREIRLGALRVNFATDNDHRA